MYPMIARPTSGSRDDRNGSTIASFHRGSVYTRVHVAKATTLTRLPIKHASSSVGGAALPRKTCSETGYESAEHSEPAMLNNRPQAKERSAVRGDGIDVRSNPSTITQIPIHCRRSSRAPKRVTAKTQAKMVTDELKMVKRAMPPSTCAM
eukprot:372233-Prymnesium_polylepis.1